MKTRIFTTTLLLVALGLTGCSTVNSRIKEKPDTFASLTPEQQARVKDGEVAIGDNSDTVYIALGNPDARRERRTADGRTTEWIYRSYRQEYVGSSFVGFRRVVSYNPHFQRYYVTHIPVHSDVYAERVEDDIRVTFRDGKVTMIEQKT